MSVAKETVACPFCREQIHPQATKCKHCQSDLTAVKKKKPSIFAKYNSFRYGFAVGVVFAVVVALLGYIEFFSE